MHSCKVVVLLILIMFFAVLVVVVVVFAFSFLSRPITRHFTKQTHRNMESIGFIN